MKVNVPRTVYLCYVTAEISRVRGSVLSFSGGEFDALDLPEAVGPVVTLSEKLTIPVKEHPEVFMITASNYMTVCCFTVH